MNNWYESVSKWIFLPQNDNLNGQNDDEPSNFGEYPILRQAQFWFKDFPQQKMDKQKRMKRKEYYVAPSTVGAAGCLSYIPQIEFDLPCKSSPLCAPFASHCCTSCRMKPNHWSLPTSSISPCDWSEGSEISREPPQKNGAAPVFPLEV